jgi:hypothetical protein
MSKMFEGTVAEVIRGRHIYIYHPYVISTDAPSIKSIF